MKQPPTPHGDSLHQGRDDAFMDIDRMVNEGLAGGTVTSQNGRIGETTVDTMEPSPEPDQEAQERRRSPWT